MMKLTPAIKGLITAIAMILVFPGILLPMEDTKLQFLGYIAYALGICWTLIGFYVSPSFTGKFSDLFNQGFRCFIVVTLIMVIFIGIFIKAHPELSEQERIATIEYYKKEGNKTPEEIESQSIQAKKNFLLASVAFSVPRYLILGAAVTTVLSLFLRRRK